MRSWYRARLVVCRAQTVYIRKEDLQPAAVVHNQTATGNIATSYIFVTAILDRDPTPTHCDSSLRRYCLTVSSPSSLFKTIPHCSVHANINLIHTPLEDDSVLQRFLSVRVEVSYHSPPPCIRGGKACIKVDNKCMLCMYLATCICNHVDMKNPLLPSVGATTANSITLDKSEFMNND